MARASLVVSEELARVFKSAQDGKTRWLRIRIEDEAFVHEETYALSEDVRADFEAMSTRVQEEEAALFFFCKENNATALPWVLVAFVPDTCSVRQKMLYSSSREGLKKQLGYNYFTSEFQVSDKGEFTFKAWQTGMAGKNTDVLFSEAEIIRKEHDKLETVTSIKSTAMGVVPFEISKELKVALENLKTTTTKWVEMTIDPKDESVQLVRSIEPSTREELPGLVNQKEPTFIAVKLFNSSYFIFSCPENASVRQKMTYSTCKATLLAATRAMNLIFEQVVEIREASELLDNLADQDTIFDMNTQPKSFSRPSAPGSRNNRRGRGRAT